jgi:hypothetical protein
VDSGKEDFELVRLKVKDISDKNKTLFRLCANITFLPPYSPVSSKLQELVRFLNYNHYRP